MNVQTQAELIDWLKDSPEGELIATDAGLEFRSHDAKGFCVEFPKEPGRLVFLANFATMAHWDEQDWNGALIWFKEWDIWGDQEIGYRMVERVRLGFGSTKQFKSATVQQFRRDERLDAAGTLLLSMLFGWDTWYAPFATAGDPDFLAFVSHDGFVKITCRTKEAYENAFNLFSKLKFDPKTLEG